MTRCECAHHHLDGRRRPGRMPDYFHRHPHPVTHHEQDGGTLEVHPATGRAPNHFAGNGQEYGCPRCLADD